MASNFSALRSLPGIGVSVLALAATAAGIHAIQEPLAGERWLPGQLTILGIFLVVSFAVGALLAIRPLSRLFWAGVASVLWTAAFGPVACITLWAALGSSLLVGASVFRALKIIIEDDIDRLVATCVGLVVLSTIIFGMVQLPINSPQTYAALTAILLLLSVRILGREGAVGALGLVVDKPQSTEKVAWLEVLFFGLAFAALVMVLTYARLPETGNDQLLMHLYIPNVVATEGRFEFDPRTYQVGYFAFGGGWLYTYGVMFAGDLGADAFNGGFATLTTVGVFLIAKQAIGRGGGAIAAALFASAPIVCYVTAVNFQENHLALLSLAAFASVMKFAAGGPRGWSAIFAALVGGAAAAKLLGLVWAAPMGLWLLFAIFRQRRTIASDLIYLFGLPVIAFVATAIWPYLAAYIGTGNPTFPFYNDIFHSPLAPDTRVQNSLFATPPTLADLMSMSIESSPFLESSGPTFAQFLVFSAPFLLLAFFNRARALALAAFLAAFTYIIIVGQEQNYIRYFYPALPMLAIAYGIGAQTAANGGRAAAALTTIALGATLFSQALYAPGSYVFARRLAPTDMFGTNRLEEIRDERRGERRLALLARYLVPADEKVMFIYRPYMADLGSRAEILHPFYSPFEWDAYMEAGRRGDVLSFFRQTGTRWVISAPTVSFSFSTELAEALANSADVVASQGGANLYHIRDDAYFTDTALEIASFPPPATPGWSTLEGVYLQGGVIGVDHSRYASYDLPWTGGRPLLLQQTYRCRVTEGTAQMQVNWRSESHEMLQVDIRPAPCAGGTVTHQETFNPPPGAAVASIVLSAPGGQMAYISALTVRR